MIWDIQADAAKAEIKAYPELAREANRFPTTKKDCWSRRPIPRPAPFASESLSPRAITPTAGCNRRATVAGSYVLAHGQHDNTSIFKLEGKAAPRLASSSANPSPQIRPPA